MSGLQGKVDEDQDREFDVKCMHAHAATHPDLFLSYVSCFQGSDAFAPTPTLALLLGCAAGHCGPSMLVRETAARELDERWANWGYSKPVVALDIM